MKNQVFVLACMAVIEIANTLTLQPDSTPNGLMFSSPSEIIYIKNQTQVVLYSIDTSDVNKMMYDGNMSACNAYIGHE